jgi:hypothetical protein
MRTWLIVVLLYLSPILLSVFHDAALCNIAPNLALHAGDDGSCTAGWYVLGIFMAYVVAFFVALIVMVLGAIYTLGSSDRGAAGALVKNALMWLPLIGPLLFNIILIAAVLRISV